MSQFAVGSLSAQRRRHPNPVRVRLRPKGKVDALLQIFSKFTVPVVAAEFRRTDERAVEKYVVV